MPTSTKQFKLVFAVLISTVLWLLTTFVYEDHGMKHVLNKILSVSTTLMFNHLHKTNPAILEPINRNTTCVNHSNLYILAFEDLQSSPYFYKPRTSHPNDKYRQKYNLPQSDRLPEENHNKTKLIVFFNRPGWFGDYQSKCMQGIQMCPVTSCQCSEDPSKLSEADGVIIDGVELKPATPPPKRPHQAWIFFGLESPFHYGSSRYRSEKWRHMFNWTMTYRLDSDIPMPYDALIRTKGTAKNFTKVALQKRKGAVWFVSNCNTPSKRRLYVDKLRQHYDVDIYGRCGKGQASLNILNKYRFYLAFENSICVDYITEKLFKTYSQDLQIIPIVRGGADYDSLIPNGTYINTASYSSPEKLAQYLKYLEKNVTAYSEMLRLKDQYVHEGRRLTNGFCDICVKLHNLTFYSNYYTNVGQWLNQDICRLPNDY